jgi:hypothetical protein
VGHGPQCGRYIGWLQLPDSHLVSVHLAIVRLDLMAGGFEM